MTKTQTPAKADEQMGIRPKGYRLPESTHLGRVRLQVAELDRVLQFVDLDGVAARELAPEQLLRELVLDAARDHPPQRAGFRANFLRPCFPVLWCGGLLIARGRLAGFERLDERDQLL